MNEDEYKDALSRLTKSNEDRKQRAMNEPREWPMPERTVIVWQHAGFDCAIMRGPMSYCGYVHVPGDHPWASMWYDDVMYTLDWNECDFHELTFRCKSMSGGAWFGFDTAHCDDFDRNKAEILKKFVNVGRGGGHKYMREWSDVEIESVMKETENLADTAAKAKKGDERGRKTRSRQSGD